jgi:hypothetical protein
MELTPYLDSLRRDLAASAAAGGPEVGRAAELLAGALDASARLTLLEALSDAAAEITAALDDVAVDVRLRGRNDADLVITAVEHPAPAPPPQETPDADGDTARLTLRLPEHLKPQVETAAAADGMSVNSWLVRAVHAALHGRTTGMPPLPPMPPAAPRRGRRITGFVQG